MLEAKQNLLKNSCDIVLERTVSKASEWEKSMKEKVLVAGCGISGIGALKLLLQVGESVILYDGNDRLAEDDVRRKAGVEQPYELVLGPLTEEVLAQLKYCVISPGIPMDVPFVKQLQEAGVPIWSEIELAYQFGKGRIAAITGTNGKTTTTALTGLIMENWVGADKTHVVGNIGTPYTERALQMTDDSITVAEISSFQLETILDFHPNVSAILNITPDHLNRHKTMDCYAQVKESITKNQTADEAVILNYEDERLRAFGGQAPLKVVWFSSQRQLEQGFWMDGNTICYTHDGETEIIVTTDECNLVGQCNYENIMAACGIAVEMGVPMDIIRKSVREFRAVEHRIEYTVTKKGVKYYNDSKATNTDAAIQGVKAMTTPTILIGGGYDKGSEYDDWIATFGDKIKQLILIGATSQKIADCARKHGFTNLYFAETLEEAVRTAAANAVPGDAVLLSPACASWGMFDNYEQRGRIFKDLCRALPEV